MGKTTIQWCDRSLNPIRARIRGTDGRSGHYCEKVSPGCRNCYSSRMQPRFGLPQFQEQRSRDDIEIFLDTKKLTEPLRVKTPQKWFWCDMTDMFGDWVSDEWIAACFGVMAATPQHTHQVLTKRPDRMRAWFEWAAAGPDGRRDHAAAIRCSRAACAVGISPNVVGYDTVNGTSRWWWPLLNVWLGVSAEDQRRADERVPQLLQTPAAVRFVSYEPALGPIDFSSFLPEIIGKDRPAMPRVDADGETRFYFPCVIHRIGVDWIIVGGESGAAARPFDIAWARQVRDQCAAAGVACFVKQLGKNARTNAIAGYDDAMQALGLRDSHGGDMEEWPADLRVRQFPGTP